MQANRLQAKPALGNNRFDIGIMEIAHLRGHEMLNPRQLIDLQAEIKTDGILKKPIAVDMNTNVVLDGHHRIGALKLLGCSKIPVLLVDYQCPHIGVKAADKQTEYPKHRVIQAALTGKPLLPKSTWHYTTLFDNMVHISEIQKRVDTPLNVLK